MHDHTHELTLGLSFFLGAVHALEPGHGKTALLVYLLDGRRSWWHPLVMAISTAASHSISLFLVAFAVHLTQHLLTGDHRHEANVAIGLQWLSSSLVLVVGSVMLWQALRGRQGGCCTHSEHASDHHHHAGEACCHTARRKSSQGASQEAAETAIGSFRTTAILGVAVGLLPCPSALAACFAGWSSGSPATAYLIIGVFAAGIASSLLVVGLCLQHFGAQLSRRAQIATRLPWGLIRAALILLIGCFSVGRLLVA